MARSDLLISLVRSGSGGDEKLFRQTVEALAAEERAKQHHVLADQLVETLKTSLQRPVNGRSTFESAAHALFSELIPERSLNDLILSETIRSTCQEVIEEHHRRELLHSYNLEPRHRLLFVGPPGNGKTSLAEALAEGLMVPLLVVRYEEVIGSFLGETALRLRRVFDYARTRHCVLFFDEFDAVGKERGDVHETGEIKRVVSSLLLQIDALPSHVVVISASNHPELLDRAVWRRFQVRLDLPAPTHAQLAELFRRFEKRFGQPLGYSPHSLATRLRGATFAEAEELMTDVQRRWVLSLPNGTIKTIVEERLKKWRDRVGIPAALDERSAEGEQ